MSNKIIHIPDEYMPEIKDLPGDLRRIAEAIEEVWPDHGVKVALLLGQLFPGVPLYPHNIERLVRRMRDDKLRAEYDQGGVTMKELAIKTRLSKRRIEQIMSQAPSQEELKDRQLKMF